LSGGETVKHVSVVGGEQPRQAGLGQRERPPDVDRLHQVELLERQLPGAGLEHRAGVVDADVDAAEASGGHVGRPQGVGSVADIADHRDRRVHGPRQPRVRLVGLSQQHPVGPVTGGGDQDREPDTAAAAGDHDRPASQSGSHHRHPAARALADMCSSIVSP
jgi:hypothetical protein